MIYDKIHEAFYYRFSHNGKGVIMSQEIFQLNEKHKRIWS